MCAISSCELHSNNLDGDRQLEWSSQDAIANICYDWAQNMIVPHSPQQVGQLYFVSPRKINCFGVCNTPLGQQINFIIDEAEMPADGKGGKGVISTASMVYKSLLMYNCGEKILKVTCDNCTGQNKNNIFMFFYAWLICIGMYTTIE